jgi:hypothetical protein
LPPHPPHPPPPPQNTDGNRPRPQPQKRRTQQQEKRQPQPQPERQQEKPQQQRAQPAKQEPAKQQQQQQQQQQQRRQQQQQQQRRQQQQQRRQQPQGRRPQEQGRRPEQTPPPPPPPQSPPPPPARNGGPPAPARNGGAPVPARNGGAPAPARNDASPPAARNGGAPAPARNAPAPPPPARNAPAPPAPARNAPAPPAPARNAPPSPARNGSNNASRPDAAAAGAAAGPGAAGAAAAAGNGSRNANGAGNGSRNNGNGTRNGTRNGNNGAGNGTLNGAANGAGNGTRNGNNGAGNGTRNNGNNGTVNGTRNGGAAANNSGPAPPATQFPFSPAGACPAPSPFNWPARDPTIPRLSNGQRPNFIVILLDDLARDDIGALHRLAPRDPNVKQLLTTPYLDRLLRESTLFDDFIVTSKCSTTRASLMTGRDARRTGVLTVHSGWDFLNAAETNFAQAFKQQGYATSFFGKHHNGYAAGYVPGDIGFDHVVSPALYVYEDNQMRVNGRATPTDGWMEQRLMDQILSYLKDREKSAPSQPFFMYYPSFAVHAGWRTADRSGGRYQRPAPEAMRAKYRAVPGLSPSTADLYAMAEFMDQQLGRLFEYVDRSQAFGQNTYVFAMGDNGAELFDNEVAWEQRVVSGFWWWGG